MASEIVMPRMGLTMETGIIVQWLKQEGEPVAAGEPLLEIETDKATVEIEALEGGTLGKIVAAAGQEIPVGAVIAYMVKAGETAEQVGKLKVPAKAEMMQPGAAASQSAVDGTAMAEMTGKVKASPAARRLAKDLGVSLTGMQGSGPGGRIVAWNVAEAGQAIAPTKAQPETQAPARVSPVAQRVAADMGVDLATIAGSGPGGAITRRDVELAAQSPALSSLSARAAGEAATVTPLSRIQRVMAERMTHSFGTAPHFYLHTEVDARQLVSLRQQLLPRLEESDQVHVTFTDLLIYFCGRVLPRYPLVMAQWTAEGLRQFHRVHIGIAVETENGLVVPVLRNADELGLVEIARQRADLAERGRRGKLLPAEFEEGVFTITNLGMYRVDSFDAILNPTQAAILAVGRIRERALVENSQVVAAPMLTLSLSVDHRVLDGAGAARFLSALAEMIETPALSMK